MEKRVRKALTRRFSTPVADASRLAHRGGHASLRTYYRVRLPDREELSYPRGEHTLAAMVLPPPEDPLDPQQGYADQEKPFVNVQQYLHHLNIPVPAIDLADPELGVILLEDLGDEHFEDAVLDARRNHRDPATQHEAVAAHYRDVLDLLLDFQERTRRNRTTRSANSSKSCIGFERAFERDLLRWELDHYLKWGLEARLDEDTLAPHRASLEEAFDRIVEKLLDLPYTLVLHDYQSRNLMRKGGRWHVIDFQDALMGPFPYDAVALLRDSYITLDPALMDALLDYYVDAGRARGLPWYEDEKAARRAFHLQTVQRKLKDAGRFVFLDREQGNPDFLPYYDPSVRYAEEALKRLDGFDDLLDTLYAVEPALGR